MILKGKSKKIVLSALAGLMLSLTACTSGTTPKESPAATQAPAATEDPTEATDEAAVPTAEAEAPTDGTGTLTDAASTTPDAAGESRNGASGTYTATSQGYGGEVSVTVTLENGVITDVSATGESETEGVGSNAIEQLPDKIVAANSTDVDAVTGATISSNAVKEAAQAALDQAHG